MYLNKNKESINNISWINTLKVLCMLMVYLNHSEFYCGTTIGILRNIYLPIFVPAFFFISGYLLFAKQLSGQLVLLRTREWFNFDGGGKTLIFNLLCRIAMPSVLFASLIYFPKKMLRGQTFDWSCFFIETFGGSSLWFTSSLTLAELIIVLLLLTRVRNVWFYVWVGVGAAFLGHIAFGLNITVCGNPNFPWFWKSSLSAVLYLALGGLYQKYETMLNKKLHLDNRLVVTFLAIFYCGYCLFDFKTYIGGLTSAPVTFGSVFLSVVGIIVVIMISKKIISSKFTEYWGRNTIGLYFLSGALPNTIAILLNKFISTGVPMILICCMFSYLMGMVVVYFLNLYLPFMFDLRKLIANHRNNK